MSRTQYTCGVCGKTYSTVEEIRGHVTGSMEANNGDHPHWDELAVSHHDFSAWEVEVPGF